MSQEGFERNVQELLTSVEICLKSRLRLPALLILYAGIDIIAWLDRPSGQADVQRKDFIAWVGKYLLPNSGLRCNALELFAARCGLLHSYTSQSRLSRGGDAKQIFYTFGSAQPEELQSLIDTIGTIPAVALQLEELFDAFRRGLERFKDALSRDTQHATLVYQRAGEWYVAEDKKELEEAMERLRRFYGEK
jgi:hypothetical protein